LFIDEYYRKQYPNDKRWDYLVDNRTLCIAYFVEVHEATSRGCKEVMEKYDWLISIINAEGSELHKYQNVKQKGYYWIRTGKNRLNPNDMHYKRWKTSKKFKHIALCQQLRV